MSLFNSIQMGNNAMTAAQLGLQVIGNNISNANTPGYAREELVLSPAVSQRKGNLLLGLGVNVEAVVQKIDRFLEDRLRGAAGDLAGSEVQEKAHLQLEAIIGELSDTDLSSGLSNFFSSVQDVLNQPDSLAVRNMARLRGETLADDIRRMDSRVLQLRRNLNTEVKDSVRTINELLNKVARLNLQIVSSEGSDPSSSDAVGLRDQRSVALMELNKLLDIRAVEQDDGAMTVFIGGEYVVFAGEVRHLATEIETDRGIGAAKVVIGDTDFPVATDSGKLAGLMDARDNILAGFRQDLDDLTQSLIFEFNRLHAGGQGLSGHTELTSEFAVDKGDLPLDQAGLPFTPENGSFQLLLRDTQTGAVQTTDVFVPLSGLDGDATLDGLAGKLDEIDGLSAEVTTTGRLSLRTESPLIEFAFADDTSGVLAALGLNTFFSGRSSSSIGVNEMLREDPGKFAASRGGIGADTANAIDLASFFDRPLESTGGTTISEEYDRLVGTTTQAADTARSVAEGFRVFHQTLEGQHFAASGVSLDEEVIKMITFQRMFQASARFVSTVTEMLDVLVNL